MWCPISRSRLGTSSSPWAVSGVSNGGITPCSARAGLEVSDAAGIASLLPWLRGRATALVMTESLRRRGCDARHLCHCDPTALSKGACQCIRRRNRRSGRAAIGQAFELDLGTSTTHQVMKVAHLLLDDPPQPLRWTAVWVAVLHCAVGAATLINRCAVSVLLLVTMQQETSCLAACS